MYKLVVGIGNYGKEYENTRHNVGFNVVNSLAKHLSTEFKKYHFQSLFFDHIAGLSKIVVIKPQNYVNLSGISVAAWKQYYKIKPEHIIVIHDDMDLELGNFKIKLGGSGGGHNGIKSIIKDIGSSNFVRIKIGIARPDNSNVNYINYVLGKITKREQLVLDDVYDQVLKALDFYLIQNNSLSKTMSFYNKKPNR